MKNKSILINLSEDEFIKFSKICSKNGYTKNGWVRSKIKEFIKKEENDKEKN